MTNRLAHISRDPFARQTLMRETVRCGLDTFHNATCQNCGSTSDTPRANYRRLFRYIISPDAGRDNPIKGLFCSIECMRPYHNG